MRAASRLTQPQKLRNAFQRIHRLGALPQPVVHVETAKQLNRGAPAVTKVHPPSHPHPATTAAAASTVNGLQDHAQFHRLLAEEAANPGHATASAAQRRKLRQQVPVVGSLFGPPVDYHAGTSNHGSSINNSTSSVNVSPNQAALSCSRHRQLNALQSFLGYTFRDLTLLDQACTHDSSGNRPSYRELAFVGDAALWLLFAEHAFRTYGCTEDPISGGWPAHLSRLLSRANCAATARQWGLDAYLQHSTPPPPPPQQQQQQQSILLWQGSDGSHEWNTQGGLEGRSAAMQLASEDLPSGSSSSSSSSTSTSGLGRTSSSSSSSSSSSGMYAGVWTGDTLAEMFEGLVGALLLDSCCDHDTLKQLLLPWVASSMDASKQAAAAAAAESSAMAGSMTPPAGPINPAASCSAAVGARTDDRSLQVSVSGLQQLQDLQRALQQQLRQHCGLGFDSPGLLAAAGQHMMQVMQLGVSCAEAETQKFLGFAVLQFAAALQAYYYGGNGRASEACHRVAGCVPLLQDSWRDGSGADSDSSSSSSSPGSAGRKASVHQMSKHAARLTTVRHRAKMWLLLLEGTPWCPEPSYLTSSSWKKQKQALARCLDLLLAAVYLDSGLEAAVGLATVLIQTTPPTTQDKSWMPAWARQKW